MTGIIVCEIPGKRKHRLQQFLADFMDAGTKHYEVLLEADDYKSARVARNCLSIAAKNGRYPIKVSIRGNRVFLTRTDM